MCIRRPRPSVASALACALLAAVLPSASGASNPLLGRHVRFALRGCTARIPQSYFVDPASHGDLLTLNADYTLPYVAFIARAHIGNARVLRSRAPVEDTYRARFVPQNWREALQTYGVGMTIARARGRRPEVIESVESLSDDAAVLRTIGAGGAEGPVLHVRYRDICYAETHWEK